MVSGLANFANPILANPFWAKSIFVMCCCVVVVCCCCVLLLCVGVLLVLVWLLVLDPPVLPCGLPAPDTPALDPLRRTAQNFAFFLSRSHFRSFCVSLGVFSLNFGVFEGRDDPEPPGFHTTARETKRAHFRAPALQKHHQNSTRRHPERHKKSEFCGGRGEKKPKFWAVRQRVGPAEGGSDAGWSRESTPTTTTRTTTTTITTTTPTRPERVEAKPRMSVAPRLFAT